MRHDETVRRWATALAAGCVLLVGGTLLALALPGVRSWFFSTASGAPAYIEGALVDVPASLYEHSQRTLIIFARSSCGSCQRAKPFLVRLVSEVQDDRGWAVRMLTTGQDELADLEYAREIGLERSAVTRAPPGLRLSSVPTVVLVDGTGVILFSQEGRPESPLGEEDVTRAVIAAGRLR
jgi:hypothetical protein